MVHYEVGPHNFLLDDQLDLKIFDFGGSSANGSRPEICVDTRYVPADDAWCRGWKLAPAGDIFGFGSTLYYIATRTTPFHHVESGEVDKRFSAGVFPVVDGVLYGDIILTCWTGQVTSADKALSAFMSLSEDTSQGERTKK